MKKLAVLTVALIASCLTGLAQGNLTFNSASASSVWNLYSTPGTPFKAGATLDVGLFISTTVTNAVPTTYLNGGATPTNGTANASWTGILTDPNYSLASSTNNGGTPLIIPAGGAGPAAGQYAGGLVYLNGTSVGQGLSLYVLGWSNAYATPTLAAAAGSPVGFSAPIYYVLGSAGQPGGSLATAGISPFGVSPVPEPSTFALAGLGAAALMIFRRKK